jgi:citrate lyase subunit beta/citryl-CoA lyase
MTTLSSHHPIRLRRSVLCLPASNARAIAKLPDLDFDAVILDLEDAVAEDRKAEARDNIRALFRDRPVAGREIIIRANGLQTSHFAEDMQLVIDCEPDAVLIPKVERQDDILEVAGQLADSEAAGSVRIWAMIETPLAVLNAGVIAAAGRTDGGRLDCFVVGLNDLRKDTGVLPSPDRAYLVPWLMQVVLAGRAFGLGVIDSVCNEFRDPGPNAAECAQGRAMGFDGKMLIHPAQIAAANAAFAPSAAEITEAEAIIAAFADPGAHSLNAIEIGGRMVERLHYEQAKALAERVAIIKSRTRPQ